MRGAHSLLQQKKGCKLESFVLAKVKQLCEQFEECKRRKVPVNLSDAYLAFSQDLVKQYGFGHDQDLVGDWKRAAIAHENLNSFMMDTHDTMYFGWTFIPLLILPQRVIKALAPPLDEFMQFQEVCCCPPPACATKNHCCSLSIYVC